MWENGGKQNYRTEVEEYEGTVIYRYPVVSIILFSSEGGKKKRIWIYS